MKMSVTEIVEKDRRKEREQEKKRKAPQQGLKAAKPARSSLPLSHIRILILMRVPVFPPLFFPSDDLNMKNLKSTNSRSCVSQFDLEPHSRHQPWQTRCSKQAGAAFIRGSWCFLFFLQCDTTSPCHLPFSKIRPSRCASCLCVVFRWASQPRPSVMRAFAAMLLADCCLQPSLTVWRGVKYSLLNCQARTGWEPSQAFAKQQHWIPPPLQTQPNQINNSLQPIQNQILCTPSSCHTSLWHRLEQPLY